MYVDTDLRQAVALSSRYNAVSVSWVKHSLLRFRYTELVRVLVMTVFVSLLIVLWGNALQREFPHHRIE